MSHSQQHKPRTSRTSTQSDIQAHEEEDGRQAADEDRAVQISYTHSDTTSRRCWICFEEEDDADILAKGAESSWRQPCKCSLMAHEDCLLSWVDETQKTTAQGVNSSRTIRCPQCKEPYRIRSQHSLSVSLMTFADGWITRGLFATIPLGFAKAIGITCFCYGQGAMLDVLGEDRLTELILSLSPGDEVRYLIGASCIPFALIGSRFNMFSFVLPLIPSLVCFSDTSFITAQQSMQSSPALWICVLPWLRNMYSFSWNKLIGPVEKRWKAEAGLSKPNVTEFAPGIEIREVRGPDVPQEQQDRRPDQDIARDVQDQEDGAFAERWIFVEAPRFARLIAGALLLPKVSVVMGNLLDRLPTIRNRYPHKFQRVIIGGVTFVLLKDMISLLYLYNRAKGRSTRQIINRKAFQSS